MEKVLGMRSQMVFVPVHERQESACDFILPALFGLDRLQSARLLITYVGNLKADNSKGLSDEDCI